MSQLYLRAIFKRGDRVRERRGIEFSTPLGFGIAPPRRGTIVRVRRGDKSYREHFYSPWWYVVRWDGETTADSVDGDDEESLIGLDAIERIGEA